jgi:hypothetical protein
MFACKERLGNKEMKKGVYEKADLTVLKGLNEDKRLFVTALASQDEHIAWKKPTKD